MKRTIEVKNNVASQATQYRQDVSIDVDLKLPGSFLMGVTIANCNAERYLHFQPIVLSTETGSV